MEGFKVCNSKSDNWIWRVAGALMVIGSAAIVVGIGLLTGYLIEHLQWVS